MSKRAGDRKLGARSTIDAKTRRHEAGRRSGAQALVLAEVWVWVYKQIGVWEVGRDRRYSEITRCDMI